MGEQGEDKQVYVRKTERNESKVKTEEMIEMIEKR